MSTPIAIAILGAGLVLMVSAFRDESPVDVVLIALGRGPSTPAKLGAGGATLGLGGAKGSPKTPAPAPSSPKGGGVVPGAGGGGGGGSW